MSDININEHLAQLRAAAAKAQGKPNEAAEAGAAADVPSFTEMLKDSIDKVNELKTISGDKKKAFELGDPNVSLAEVMIASEKAGIAFQAMVQTRNKLVEAYRDIMNMSM